MFWEDDGNLWDHDGGRESFLSLPNLRELEILMATFDIQNLYHDPILDNS